MKCIRISYSVRPEVNLDEVKTAITEFVAAIAAHHPGHRYSSFQFIDNPREFIHVGELVEEAVADFQSQPFFRTFSEYLHQRCNQSPKSTSLTRVASTLATNR